MENLNKKLASGFAWESSMRLIVQLASWVSTIWVARILTPDDYGIVSISGIFTGLCITLSGLGLSQALINKTTLEEWDKANVFWTSCIMAATFYLILFLSAPYIGNYYKNNELVLVVRAAGIIVIASPLSIVPRAIVARELRYKEMALLNMMAGLSTVLITLALAIMGFGFWALVISTVSNEIILLIAYMALSHYIPRKPGNLRSVVELYHFGFHVMGGRLAAYFTEKWPPIISSKALGQTSTGFFQMAYNLANLPMVKVGEVFSQVAYPAFSRIKSDREQVRRVFLLMNRYFFMIVSPMFLGLALVAPQAIPLLLGDKWLPIVFPIQILCLTNIIKGSCLLIPTLLEGLGNPKSSMIYKTILAITSPVTMIIGSKWGLEGLMVGFVCSYPLATIYLFVKFFRILDLRISEFVKTLATTLVSCLLMSACVLAVDAFMHSGAAYSLGGAIAIKISIGIFSYILSSFFLAKEDLKRIYSLLRNKANGRA